MPTVYVKVGEVEKNEHFQRYVITEWSLEGGMERGISPGMGLRRHTEK